jgi:hypothetical protein
VQRQRQGIKIVFTGSAGQGVLPDACGPRFPASSSHLAAATSPLHSSTLVEWRFRAPLGYVLLWQRPATQMNNEHLTERIFKQIRMPYAL